MAYAAVVSTKQKIEHLLHPSYSNIPFPRSKIVSIHHKLCSLESVLVSFNLLKGNTLWVGPFDNQIKDVVGKLEDLIEDLASSYGFVSESNAGSSVDERSDTLIFLQGLIKVEREISSITEKLKKIEVQQGIEIDRKQGNFSRILSRDLQSSGGSKLVGLDFEQTSLRKWLGVDYVGLKIVPVFGMAGIGKTTLVQYVCDDTYVSGFETCLMVTVGPNYKLREFLLLVLDHLGLLSLETHQKLWDEELGKHLRHFLKGQRYLIVLDDVWSVDVWNELKQFFPDEQTSSRIILTTRLLRVAVRAATTLFHIKCFMSVDDSWHLLRELVFNGIEEFCNFQLEKLGKEIAKNCEGLPLAIVSIAQHLREHAITVEYWEKVSKDDNPLKIGIDDSTLISKSLYLSYEMLPHREKELFLYVGVFPKTYKVFVDTLINLWAIEGFIQADEGRTMEKVGRTYVYDLYASSVVLISEVSSRIGEIKSVSVHVVFRNLCIAEAQKEKFCLVMKKYAGNFPQVADCVPRLCIHNNVMLGLREVRNYMESLASVHSLLCFGTQHTYLLKIYLCFRLLKVLDALRIRFYDFPCQVFKLVRLRYLALTYDGELSTSISELWNLEVFLLGRHQIIKSSNAPMYLPMEIWNLKWLRHLSCLGRDLPIPSDGSLILENLLTLSGVTSYTCKSGVLSRVPNLKKLGIRLELAPDEVETFNFFGDVAKQLQYLESFKCVDSGFNSRNPPRLLNFSTNLMKLTLSGNGFPWKLMAGIEMLPKLQVLKLRCNSFRGAAWKMRNGAFPMLKVLLLEDLDIEDRRSELFVMKKLQKLIIKHCYKLKQIPLQLASSELSGIELEDCCLSVMVSVRQIYEATRNRGPRYGELSHLNVVVYYSWDDHPRGDALVFRS